MQPGGENAALYSSVARKMLEVNDNRFQCFLEIFLCHMMLHAASVFPGASLNSGRTSRIDEAEILKDLVM